MAPFRQLDNLEPGIHSDLAGKMDYASYLRLDQVLSAQRPLSAHHDEMLFIIMHQVAELWFKLVLHELRAAREHICVDDIEPCEKILSRVKATQRQLFEQWAVLETLTPSEYVQFRHLLGPASGLQSRQFRLIEFILGNKQAEILALYAHDEPARRELQAELERPTLYDEFLRHLGRCGHPVPRSCIERDWSRPHQRNAELVKVFACIYAEPEAYWKEYALCEKLVDIDEHYQLWRFRHMKTVERIIGYKPGTGGSSGVAFLKKIVDRAFFPELLDLRTAIGAEP
ncbi:tryptophan 2,3-dioxygenase family protein [Methylocystis sp. IM3]|uniref:tryptophan 2,3-dioxygenase n=1 Tax=unclassified Methylocystis TaxID=2625913 RepID=UPI0026CC03EA